MAHKGNAAVRLMWVAVAATLLATTMIVNSGPATRKIGLGFLSCFGPDLTEFKEEMKHLEQMEWGEAEKLGAMASIQSLGTNTSPGEMVTLGKLFKDARTKMLEGQEKMAERAKVALKEKERVSSTSQSILNPEIKCCAAVCGSCRCVFVCLYEA
uniref:Uncharacterized protein n=1 Tax=Lotharella globosa TaxID=91324 RepID=A0A7S3Z736_9EUKA